MAVMDIVVQAIDKASDVLANIGDKGTKAAQTLDKNWLKASAALAATGVAIEALARTQAPLTEGTRKLAASIGVTDDEMRRLVLSTTNVTRPIGDVIGLFEAARQQGIRTTEGLQNFAAIWDTVADATGENSVALAEASVALRALGINADNQSDAMGALGFVLENTTLSVGDFLDFVRLTGPNLAAMGLSIDETAAIVGYLEGEFGLTGRTLKAEFNKAVTQADGDLQAMYAALNINTEKLAEYTTRVEQSSDIIERNADIHAQSYTLTQKMQQAVAELTYKYGEHIHTVSNLVPIMTTIGPLIKGITSAKGLMTLATKAQTVATTAFGTAMGIVTSPIFLVIAAITAAVAIGWYLYKNWDEVVEKVTELWGRFSEWFGEKWQGMLETVQNIGLAISTFFTETWQRMLETVRNIGASISGFFTNMVDGMMTKARNLKEGFISVFQGIANGIRGPLNGAIEAANAAIRGLNRIQVSIPSWVPLFGGKSFGINIPEIPRLHYGGMFRADRSGGEGLALLRDGERVLPRGASRDSGGGVVVVFEQGAFEGMFVSDDYGVDRLMDRVIARLEALGVRI